MIRSNAFNNINVLDKAADATWLRNQLITNNIANKDTPNYKRKDINFQGFLENELRGPGTLNQKIAGANLNALNASVYTDHGGYSYRLDGNNVDPDMESASLAENQIRYYNLIDSISQEFNRIKIVLQSN